jgi:uncharacterized protein YkwD/LysM repeat protein
MKKPIKPLTLILLLGVVIWGISAQKIQAAPAHDKQRQGSDHSPSDLIDAVNQLRLTNGLPALNVHPALMQIAQWEANAIASGAPGHTRPAGLTLGQWMISLDYPLGGNIALDGYRSENWVGGSEMTVQEAIESWLGDAPHTNTMLSPYRSDIGAGVAVGEDDWGKPVYYYVIETALQTSSGQQQYEALVLLTALPQTQAAGYSDATQAAEALLVPQYQIPVSLATARPDGDVIHEVKYGQTLWSIAVAYRVRIDDIKRLNNLSLNTLWTDQKLLIQKGATQPAPTLTDIPTQEPRVTSTPPAPAPKSTASQAAERAKSDATPGANSTLILFLAIAVLVPGVLTWLFIQERRQNKP